jgi:hypothetical protein
MVSVQRGERGLLLEIEHDRPLVAVEVHELAGQFTARRPAAEGAQEVAGRCLDLDDVGAVVGEIERRRRPDHDGGQVDHADACKCSSTHRAPPLIVLVSFGAASAGAASASVSSTW